MPRQGLRKKIVRLVLLSTFATALGVGGISVHATYSFLWRSINESQPLVLERGAERVRTWLQQGQEEVAQLARSQAFSAWQGRAGARGASPGQRDRELTEILGELLSLSRSFSGLVFIGTDGQILASAGAGPELHELVELLKPKRTSESELLEVMRSAELRGQLSQVRGRTLAVFDAKAGGPVPLASLPARDNQGRALGSLHGLFEREGLAAQLRTDLLTASANVFLVDAKGAVVAAGRELAAGEARSFPPEMLRAAGGGVRHYAGAGGRREIGSARPVGLLGWTLVVQQTRDEALQPLVAVLTRMLVADLAIVLLFAGLAFQIATTIVRPVRALSASARRICEGELDVDLPAARSGDEIGLLISTFNDMAARLRQGSQENERIRTALEKQNRAFQQANQLLALLSTTDGLTKLYNHRYFQDQLTRELKRVHRSGEPLSLLIVDIDNFKKLNDSCGHAAGDEVLVRVAQILKDSIRQTDVVARYGGEEFVVVAVATKLEGAAVLAEKIRHAVADASFLVDESMKPRKVTVSIGVSQFAGSRKKLFEEADAALYRAKAAGKDCVVTAPHVAAA